jgi:BMFP domain-containing protein YqiC
MDPMKHADSFVKRLSSMLPDSLQQVREDIESNVRQGAESRFRDMNLVTREEFDVQNAVLLRTREKLEKLEEEVRRLEEQLASRD